MVFQLVQTVYWLALSTWFGGVLFIAIAAQCIFQTVRQNNPILPGVLSVNLDKQHATLLAGSIVGDLLHRLTLVQLICGAALLACFIAQPFVINIHGFRWVELIIRAVLFIAAMVLVFYQWRVLWPRIVRHRQEYIDHADEPDVANPAKEQFDYEHRRSVMLLQAILFLLLGIIFFSVMITPQWS
jgi:hypothetical protein